MCKKNAVFSVEKKTPLRNDIFTAALLLTNLVKSNNITLSLIFFVQLLKC